jgi:hypothetical protein
LLKKVLFAILAVALLLVPLVIRWFTYYEGQYEPALVSRPDLTKIQAPTPATEPFVDQPGSFGPGTVLVDMAHDNRVVMADLSVLQSRLSARGQQVEIVESTDTLNRQLRYAKALVVVSPGLDWASDEIEQVQGFVEKGGRLLLVTDPTRYGIEYDEWELPVIDDDVPHINDLAARFGLLFQADYLYNTADNAGNFRNIKLTDFGKQDLTQGLDQVVFYATHSIASEERALISSGGETRSSANERDGAMAVAVLVADGNVLALGDLTFMSEPYTAAYDNERFVANIADFLSGARREYDLDDFPFYFGDRADLVYAGGPLLDSDFLQASGSLQTLFADEGKELTLRAAEDGTSDTLIFGLYEGAEDVEPYLTAVQVTLSVTPTMVTDGKPPSTTEPTPGPKGTPTPTFTSLVTVTSTVTKTSESDAVPRPAPEITATAPTTPGLKSHIEVESLGEVVVTGTLLLLWQSQGERQVLVGLADTEAGLENVVKRLVTGNLEGCLLHETEDPPSTLALCSSGEVQRGDGGGGWQEPEPALPTAPPPITSTVEPGTPVDGPEGNIVVVSLDHGTGRYDGISDAQDFERILADRYAIELWSTAEKGFPDWEYLVDFDLVIWSSGDYEDPMADDENDTVFQVMLQSIPILLSGAYIGDTEVEAVQRDIQVYDATHPLAAGFQQGEVVPFVAGPSAAEYETGVLADFEEDESTDVPFVRGPESVEPGLPSVIAVADELTQVRVAVIGFPLYLLPEEVKSRLVLNTVNWLLNP